MIIFTMAMHRDHLEEHAEVVFLISKMSERHREPGVTLAHTTWSTVMVMLMGIVNGHGDHDGHCRVDGDRQWSW